MGPGSGLRPLPCYGKVAAVAAARAPRATRAGGDGAQVNRGHTYLEQIDGGGAGRTVLEHLSARFGRAGPAEWRARIELGQVRLEDLPTSPDVLLRAGQWLAWDRPPWVEPPVPLDAAVIHEDALLLAVAKPRGLPTMPGGGLYLEHTLLAVVRRRYPEASPMHRLGRDTSGVVLFSRTQAAARVVQAAFRARRLRKFYVALCAGHPASDVFSVDAPIGEVDHPLLGTVHAAADRRPPRHEPRPRAGAAAERGRAPERAR